MREAVEPEVSEISWSSVLPVPVVMGLAVGGWSAAAGGLAVLVAGGERFPLRGRRGRSRAADVEDLGMAGDDDATQRAVAQQHLEQVRRKVPTASEFGAGLFDGAAAFVEMHDGGRGGCSGASTSACSLPIRVVEANICS